MTDTVFPVFLYPFPITFWFKGKFITMFIIKLIRKIEINHRYIHFSYIEPLYLLTVLLTVLLHIVFNC